MAEGFDLREAALPADIASVERLWLEYLTWGNDEMEASHGFRLPEREAVEHDLETTDQFEPPDGSIFLVFSDEYAFWLCCLRRIQFYPAEFKRFYVGQWHR